MKNRTELARHFAELGFKKGAEVGVAKGYYSRILLDNIPGLELICVDPWTVHPGHFDTAVRVLGDEVTFVVTTSMKAVKDVPDESLDFVFLDGDHRYPAVVDDVREWSKKVRSGGIVAGHDYVLSTYGTVDVIRAVDEYVAEHNLTLQLTDWDMTVEHHDDRQPCWYFTK